MRIVLGLAFILALIFLVSRTLGRGPRRPAQRGRTFGAGPGAAGTIYDMLNEDKRKAIEIIVEGRAEYADPETADDLPPSEDGARPKVTRKVD